MSPRFHGMASKYVRVGMWLCVVAAALYGYFFQRGLIQGQLQKAFYYSLFAGGLIYFAAGCLRGFTLIPSTYLVFVAIPFFPPTMLFVLTIAGILVSSASIYYFSESLGLEEYFEREHKVGVLRVRNVLQKHELPIIIGWSFFPLAPTDLICYVCGVLEVDFWKFLFGVLVGEGTICGIYIFLGDHLLRFLHVRF
ncbi:MAG TPA: VTT domain-containing protein [Candidatus Acidoferrales bacterium]|nr:VTT domain-containing protein [Candidatus Acidoferrales bacterium]